MNSGTSSQVANPFSTANGGVTFEQLVATSYLVSLLAGHIPRGLDWGITKEVRFQTRWSQCLLDDIVVIGTDGNAERKLALQIKHDVTLSASNSTFARVIKECWRTFTGSSGWQFNKSIDRLGIGIGVYQTKVARHFQPLLEWARTSKNADEFLDKLSVPHFSSEEKREYIEVIKTLLTEAKGNDITDDELWRFLRCLVVIHFDLEYPGNRDSVQCWNCLLDQLKTRDHGQAKILFNTLTSVVAEYARSAGPLGLDTLKVKIPVNLKDYPDFVPDLNHLRNHSNTVLDSIRDTIGGKVHLLRIELIDSLEDALKENEVVVITGEPMVGKSVLLKLLANRLRSEGEVIALSVDRLFGVTLENFLHNIHIQSDLLDILSAVGNAPLRCILIDGLERVLIDEDKKRVLDDLIIAVRNYNESILSKGGHKEYCWKIVFACRSLKPENILINLETRKNVANKSLETIEVGSLTDEEMTEVVDHFSKLRVLASQKHLEEILSRPLTLDILTLPDILLKPEEVPPILTETWLLKWFWRQVVRLGEESKRGRGNPDKRERMLIHIGEQSLRREKFVPISDDMDFEAISGLVSDRLLAREDNKLRFAHDVIEDWTFAVILEQEADILRFLTQIDEPLHLSRAFRLYASRFLEVEQSPGTWFVLLTTLRESTLSPRWYQITLAEPLYSPLLKKIFPQIGPLLLENNATLLAKFLNVLRTTCTIPAIGAMWVYEDLPEAETRIALSHFPTGQWIPVIQFILQNVDRLTAECLFEFSYITEKWMTKIEETLLLRREIAELCLSLLNKELSKMNLGLTLGYDKEKKLRENLMKAVLWAADILPNEVDSFVRQNVLRSGEGGNYNLEELILEEGWIPLCRHLPETALDILEAILCRKLEPDILGGYNCLFMDLGIRSVNWRPPTYLKGPFLGLLRYHPDKGLNLIHKVVNHATQCWKMREESDDNRKPLSQIIRLKNGSIEIWGDEIVYYWCRYPSVAPAAVTCALMALEYWMNKQLKNDSDPQELFEGVLKDAYSAAIIGVCSSVALANYEKCREAIVPVLENPAFLAMDFYRFTQDMTAESFIEGFSTHYSLDHEKDDYKILLDLANQSHRKYHINSFVPFILINGPEDTRERLRRAMQSFPDNPYFFYEEERKNIDLIQERIENCKIWAAQADLENYDVVREDDEQRIRFEFRLPKELEEQQKEKLDSSEERSKLYNFLGWIMNLMDKGETGQSFTIESAMHYAQDLVRQDNLSYQPKNLHEYSELRAQAIAAFAAALVTKKWQWIEENDYILWCRGQLLVAAKRPSPSPISRNEVSIFPQGYKRSAARALPILLSKYSKDREIRETIFTLALDENTEVRNYLFGGLKKLWTIDQKIIWKCIELAIKSSRKKVLDNKLKYVQIGLKRYVYPLLIRLFRKPIRDCSPEDIDTYYLQSILYCLPSDIQITQITPKDRLINFLEDLLLFTINAYVYYQKEIISYMDNIYNRWNDLLFSVIANALLRAPENVAESRFCTPIMDNWEKEPAMMEKLLRSLISIGTQPNLRDRLIELWLYIGKNILSSKYYESFEHRHSNEMKNILGLLIFVDPIGAISWKVQEWKPLKKMIPFINQWCKTVGHRTDCFPSLVRLLRTIGFSLVPEYGINWLHNCISRVDNHKKFLERGGVNTSLAELLNDSWSAYGTTIKQDPETFKPFTFLVDILVDQGEPIAVQLQSKMLEDY